MTKQITLKNLKYATKQQIFDQVSKHLLMQMERSTQAKDPIYCMYRGENGLKCAAGILIDDHEYGYQLENNNWLDLVEMRMVPRKNSIFIRDLQALHDYSNPDDWPDSLRLLAEKYKLKCNF